MSMSRMKLAGFLVLMMAGVGCAPKDEKGETDWCNPYACDPGALPDPPRRDGGVIHHGSSTSWAEVSRDEVRPEVLLVTVERERPKNGDLLVRVQSTDNGQVAVTDRQCTGTFISENEILTAAHCLLCTDFARTYAVMGFHANHGWLVEGQLMRVPADKVLQLCHVKGCKEQVHDGKSIDVALVHTCLWAKPAMKPRDLPKTQPHLRGLAIYSHAGGLPLQKHSVQYSGGSVAHFSNDAGGSGAAMVNERGEIVAVVKGNVPGEGTVVCSSGDNSGYCAGQPLTLHPQLLEVIGAPSECGRLRRYFVEHSNGCRECNGTLEAESQTGK